MAKCDYCQHVEMCGWRESLEERGCDFFDDGNKWIPVTERLPEDFQRVLVTVVNYNGNKVVRVAEYDNYKGVFRIKENHEEWDVGEKGLLAWMPLPATYQYREERSADENSD